MVPTLVLLSDREQQIISLLRDAEAIPSDFFDRTQVFGNKKYMIRIGQPLTFNEPQQGVWEMVIRRKP